MSRDTSRLRDRFRQTGGAASEPLWGGAPAYPRAAPAEKKAQGTPAPQADPPTVAWSGDTQLAATTPTP